jgi:hypothetical protein
LQQARNRNRVRRILQWVSEWRCGTCVRFLGVVGILLCVDRYELMKSTGLVGIGMGLVLAMLGMRGESANALEGQWDERFRSRRWMPKSVKPPHANFNHR